MLTRGALTRHRRCHPSDPSKSCPVARERAHRGEKRKRVKKHTGNHQGTTRGEKRKQGERVKKQRERRGGGKRTQPCAQINLDPIQGRETLEEIVESDV